MASDAFFKDYTPNAIPGGTVDLAFIDGMHLCEYVLRDFINVERSSNPKATIVMHDCLSVEWPMAEREHPPPALREQHKSAWTGDVWRTAVILKRYRPDLIVRAFDAPPSGLVCVTNLSQNSTVLHDRYADLVREMMQLSLVDVGIENLFRILSAERLLAYYKCGDFRALRTGEYI